jgi:flagellar motor component MotA
MEKNVPPPTVYHSAAVAAKVEHEADELSKLAQSIPPDVQSIAKGMFPKDVVQKLKQIEKLSKHLRSELAP